MPKEKPEHDVMKKAREMSRLDHVQTDPQGSWTGRPADPREEPVQDADDL